MRTLTPEQYYHRHNECSERLETLFPKTAFSAAWMLRHTSKAGERKVAVALEAPSIPTENPELPTNCFLMRVYLTSEEVLQVQDDIREEVTPKVDLPTVVSRQHSVVWSDTDESRAIRKANRENPTTWPS